MPLGTALPHINRRAKELRVHGRGTHLRTMSQLLAAVLDIEGLSEAAQDPPCCFGQSCAISHDKVCQACPVQLLCLHRMAHLTMPAVASEVGSLQQDALALKMGLQPMDVRVAQTLARATGGLRRKEVNAVPESKRMSQPDNDWPRRYLAERQRYPELDRLPVGTNIYREYDGVRHCVTLCDGHYQVDGKRYPTLFCVGEAITGKHAAQGQPSKKGGRAPTGSWSVRKLFGPAIKIAADSMGRLS